MSASEAVLEFVTDSPPLSLVNQGPTTRRRRCMKPCGLHDSKTRSDRLPENHYCIEDPAHAGLCDFIAPCRRAQGQTESNRTFVPLVPHEDL